MPSFASFSLSFVSLPREFLIFLVRGYRLLLSPWLGGACRFEPSCSAYALEALQVHGAAAGTGLAVRRLLRCGPWCEGGRDPVPRRRMTERFLLLAGSELGGDSCCSRVGAAPDSVAPSRSLASSTGIRPPLRDPSLAAPPGTPT